MHTEKSTQISSPTRRPLHQDVSITFLGQGTLRRVTDRIDGHAVDVILFDLGGVIITFDWDVALDHWVRHAHVDRTVLAQRFVHGEDYQRFERGEIIAEGYFAHLRDQLGIALDDATLIAGWNAIFGPPIDGIAQVLHTLKQSPFRVAGLSNTNVTHASVWPHRYGDLLAALGRILTSHELGHRKPEAACYLAACDHLGVAPAQVLFFDDLAENVAGARAVGMQSVQVTCIDDVHAALRTLGIADS